jgi:hypothetical protein
MNRAAGLPIFVARGGKPELRCFVNGLLLTIRGGENGSADGMHASILRKIFLRAIHYSSAIEARMNRAGET